MAASFDYLTKSVARMRCGITRVTILTISQHRAGPSVGVPLVFLARVQVEPPTRSSASSTLDRTPMVRSLFKISKLRPELIQLLRSFHHLKKAVKDPVIRTLLTRSMCRYASLRPLMRLVALV